MKEYIPTPIDTSNIELPEELLNLADKIKTYMMCGQKEEWHKDGRMERNVMTRSLKLHVCCLITSCRIRRKCTTRKLHSRH